MKYPMFLLLLVLTCTKGSAQKITFTGSTEIVKDYYHRILSTPSGNYLDVQHTSPRTAFSEDRDEKNAVVAVYDHQLKYLYTKPIEAVKGKKFLISWSCGKKNYMFFSDKNTISSFELNEDGSARLIDNALIPGDEQFTGLGMGFSPDSSHAFVVFTYGLFNRKKPGRSIGAIMDRQMNVLTKFSFTDEQADNKDLGRHYVMSDDGALNIILSSQASSKSTTYAITRIDAKGKKTTEPVNGFPEGLFGNIEWYVNKDNIAFAACKLTEKGKVYSSIVTGTYNLHQKNVTDIKTNEFPEEQIPADVNLIASYRLKDNSRMLVMQQFLFQAVANSSRGIRDRVWSGNVYVVRIKESGELSWETVIYKDQWEFVTSKYTGAVALIDDYEELDLFFRDTPKNDLVKPVKTIKVVLPDGANQATACVHVTKDGKANKQFIDVKEEGFVPVMDEANTEGTSTMFCPVYNWGNAAGSRYRIGKFTVE